MAGQARHLVLVLALALVLVASGCGWTQYAGNAGRTGYAPTEHTLTVANVGQATVRWTGYGSSVDVAVTGGFVYGGQGLVSVWPVGPGPRCSGVPLVCLPQWYANSHGGSGFSDPVVDGDTMFTAEISTVGVWTVSAYDLHAPCTTDGSPSCQPVWTGVAGVGNTPAVASNLLVGGGRVYLSGDGLWITAFDEKGQTKCGGSPKVCQPLFKVQGPPFTHPPALDGSRLLIPVSDGIDVLDVTNAERCPGACLPGIKLVASNPGEVSASNGIAYTTSASHLLAFDDRATSGCGTAFPVTCQPQWRGTLAAAARPDAPVVTDTLVFANSIDVNGFTAVGGIEAFSKDPAACGGTPVTCSRTFMTKSGATFARARVSASAELLVVASSTYPDPLTPSTTSFHLDFFDLAGRVGCNAQRRCDPVASLGLGQSAYVSGQVGRPALANGVVVVPRFYESPLVVGLP